MPDYGKNPEHEMEDELLIQAYLDQELSAGEVEAFEARLLQEPSLRQTLAEWRVLYADMELVASPLLERDLSLDVVTRLDEPQVSAPRLGRLALVELAIALIIAAAAWPLWRFSAQWLGSQPALTIWPRLVAETVAARWLEFSPDQLFQQSVAPFFNQLARDWSGMLSAVSLSPQYLYPLVLVALVLWVVSTRLLWDNNRVDISS